MESLKVGVYYQLFAEQSITLKINAVVSLDTPSAFVQTICVLLEMETLLIFLFLLVAWNLPCVPFSQNFICLLVS